MSGLDRHLLLADAPPRCRPLVGVTAYEPVQPSGSSHAGTHYDLSPDGRRIYFLDGQLAAAPREIGIVPASQALLR